jgi:hypothetical protein
MTVSVYSCLVTRIHEGNKKMHAENEKFGIDIKKSILLSGINTLGGLRLSPLGTSATNWTIVPAPNDR